MAHGWESVHLDELDSFHVTETLVWRPVRRRLDVGAFGVNAYTAANAGDEIVEDHTEETYRHEELYFVASGHVEFELAGETVDAPAGTFVFIRDPTVRRHAVAKEPGSTVVAVGGPRDEAFTPSTWEETFVASTWAKQGDPGRARDHLRGVLAEQGEDASLLYNLACFESLAGDHDEAIEHLNRALELDPKLEKYVANDADLDPIREREGFPG